ncbi:hypothetical protein ASU33_07615 [Solirubrum puertoriconensis]|uniref:Uncharacterized protein n=1 Tax=Solirubrum puertoriconensis TaxID=1751427 RepID=A0A9X0HL76_SOLP1|nr:hypothetical protein ASU33_07615 [Solirubrum puertoriconensis]
MRVRQKKSPSAETEGLMRQTWKTMLAAGANWHWLELRGTATQNTVQKRSQFISKRIQRHGRVQVSGKPTYQITQL